MRARPVHLRAIARKHVVPDHRPARGDGLPVRYLLGMCEHFIHVVAGTKPNCSRACLSDMVPVRPKPGPITANDMGPIIPKWVYYL